MPAPSALRPANLLLLAGLLAEFFWVQSGEWRYNDQYRYGFFVPWLTAYLIHLRWLDRPVPCPPACAERGAILIFTGLLLPALAVRVVLGANPEWRLALALHAALLFSAALCLTWFWGGRPWVRHFLPAAVLLLLAVPWPTGLETPLVQYLVQAAATVTVEMANWAGLAAERSGNLIRLANGLVGVEEACSGVRALQSSLMSAWFMGELFRFAPLGRLGLMVLGALLALALNVVRTFVLTLLAARGGGDFTATVHDSIGHLVAVLAFALLLALALWWRPRPLEIRPIPDEIAAPLLERPARWLRWHGVVAAGLWLALPPLVATVWYRRTAPTDGPRLIVTIDWTRTHPSAQEQPIANAIEAQLRYAEGSHYRWPAAGGQIWDVFFFAWSGGRISSFAGVHRPETCLPSAGCQPLGKSLPMLWTGQGRHLVFEVSHYRLEQTPLTAFYAVWDDQPDGQAPIVLTALDRLRESWHGRRLTGRRSLEIVISGPASEAANRAAARSLLDRALRVESEF